MRPGTTQKIAVSYAKNALVQTQVSFPGQHALSLLNMTDSHGHLTVTVNVPSRVRLHNGRATARVVVQAVSGSWHVLKVLTPDLRAGITGRVAISYAPHTYIRSNLTIPGHAPVSHLSMTDGNGHLTLSVGISSNTRLPNGHVTAHMSVSAVAVAYRARVTSSLNISDMIVSMTASRIVRCVQTQEIHVAYRPNTPVRISLLFPHSHRLTLSRRTDQHGLVTAPVVVSYVKAVSPVHMTVTVGDATPRSHRSERARYALSLPRACQKR